MFNSIDSINSLLPSKIVFNLPNFNEISEICLNFAGFCMSGITIASGLCDRNSNQANLFA